MSKWTKQQQEAIEARDCNLLISAAAGSGKTAVLVERIIRLVLEDHIGIDRLLIVTFSNAAAGEMRDRILRALTDALTAHPEQAPFIRKQIHKIGRAYIMTLHAFCNDVVRKHFIEIGLDPSFKIGEVSTMELMKQEALKIALEKAYSEEDPDFAYLTESYGGNRSDEKLMNLVQRIHGFIQSQPKPLEWLSSAVDALNLSEAEFDESPAAKALMHYVRIEFEGILHLAQTGLEKCLEPEGPAEYEANFNSDLEGLERIAEALEQGYSEAMKTISEMSFTRLSTIKKDRKMEISEILMEDAKSARDQVKKKLSELKARYFAKNVSDITAELQFLHGKMERLVELVSDYQNQYQALKLDKNLLDFNDLEHYALAILENPSICQLYRDQFEHIFLDEYQDANIVQETLIERIKRPANVFLVGDVKQSIYKFRLADPSLFLDKQKRYPQEEGHSDRRIDLSMNFRTRGEVLSVVNDFFARIMSENLGEIQYDLSQYLYNGMAFPEQEVPAVSLQLVDLGEQSELDEEIQYMKTAEIEAHHVAAQLKAALGTPYYNPKTKTTKPLGYGDVAVLLRSTKQWANTFSEVFGQWGIPVFVDVGTSFFEALEVTMVLSLLKVIDNRHRDLEWITVLRSPLVGLDVEALALIRSAHQSGSFYEALQAYSLEEENEISEALRRFMVKLDNWTGSATFKRLDDWLWQILDETQFYAYAGAMPEGPARQANLRLLMERAGALEGQPESGLYHFIQVIERMERSGGDLEAAKMMPEQEDAVRIMSIHKSKGLEFPLVIVSGLGKRFNLSDTYEDIMVHKHLGLGPKFVDWQERHYRYTFPQLAMRKQMTNEMLSEEMRILYVALTRPVNALWLIGSVTNWESAYKRYRMGTKPFNLAQAKSYLDWLGMYALDDDQQTIDLDFKETLVARRVPGLDGISAKLSLSRVSISDIVTQRLVQTQTEDELRLRLVESLPLESRPVAGVTDPAAAKETPSACSHPALAEKLTRTYKGKVGLLPSKISVSALKHYSEGTAPELVYYEQVLARPSWESIETQIGPAERGTAFHKCLQHLDYSPERRYDLAALEQLKRQLVGTGALTEALAAAVPDHWLTAYIETEMFKRIQGAARLEKEYPFIVRKQIGEDWTLVQGIIDLYFEDGDGSGVLVDFKTDLIKQASELPEAVLRHKEQLSLYSEAIALIEGMAPKEVWLYFATVQQWVLVNL